MNKKLLIALPVIVILALGAWLVLGRSRIGFGAFKNYNVVLVTIDTLRADHLPSYGYNRVRTPNLDRLAKQSFLFENAFAHVPMTLPSHCSIMTGLLPVSHGVHDNAGFMLDPKTTTLAKILKGNGYQTAAFVSAFVLDSRFGLKQGFDLYSDNFALTEGPLDNTEVSRRAEVTQTEVDAWLARSKDKKFFLWVHYYDPHDPYDPPEPYRTEYKANPYDGEIAYVDHVLGKLLSDLEQSKLMDKTLIVLTGDHGESLGEHGERTHSLFIYDATLHVPLLIRLPGIKSKQIQDVVGHIDIAPTILDWLGIPSHSEMQGKSLIPVMQGKEKGNRSVYSESLFAELHYGWSPLKSLTTQDYRFIDAPTPELYEHKTDAADTKNIFRNRESIGNSLRQQLQEIEKSAGTKEVAMKSPDPETAEKLRALGYTSSTAVSTAESRKTDPKDKIAVLEKITQAHSAMDARHYQSVIDLTTPVLSEQPQMIDAHFMLSVAYLNLREIEKARAEMFKTLELKPDHIQTLYNLALLYQLQGNFDESAKWYLTLLKYEPGHLNANLNLAAIYVQSTQPDKAKPYLERVTNTYEEASRTTSGETRAHLLGKVAEIYFKSRQLEKSEKALKDAIAADPMSRSLHFNLGLIYQLGNQVAEAATEYSAETKVDPKNYKAFFNLGVVYQSMNRLNDATDSFQEVLRLKPGFQPAEERIAQIQATEKKQ